MRTVLYFVSLGNFIMIISASVIGFTLCRLFPKEKKKKNWKVFKTKYRLALTCGELTKQEQKHLCRLCQGCLWLDAESEALAMVTTLFSLFF